MCFDLDFLAESDNKFDAHLMVLSGVMMLVLFVRVTSDGAGQQGWN